MDQRLPYNLNPAGTTSREYYAVIRAFTDQWLAQIGDPLAETISGFQKFQARQDSKSRSFEECAFEMLALGVLLHEHGGEAARLSGGEAWLLARLAGWQERMPQAKPVLKIMRGLLAGLGRAWHTVKGPIYGHPSDVERLIQWLEAQGEATQAARFSEWKEYLRRLRADQARRIVRLCWKLARDFEQASLGALGAYTTQAQLYRLQAEPRVHWRYDAELVMRTRLEYHLGMLGTEILNRAFRARFAAAEKRLVIAPPCLRRAPENGCQAVQTPLGAHCAGCTPGCKINQITKLGEKQGFQVTCIPDDELSKLCQASGQAGSGIGVVGIACALRNWSAGWEADRLGLCAQGLLLDYPGCKKHWNAVELSTDIDMKTLSDIMTIRTKPSGLS